MSIYIFDVKNADETAYFGAKPLVEEIGPFVINVRDEKTGIEFRKDGEEVAYRNRRSYTFKRELSCYDCSPERMLTVPNLALFGAMSQLSHSPPINFTSKQLLHYSMLLMGEYPFMQSLRTISFRELVFDGYGDAMLSALHSPLLRFLNAHLNHSMGAGLVSSSLELPATDRIALFQNWNNSDDGEFVIKTGQRNVSERGRISEWESGADLPSTWWPTREARALGGSDSGTFQTPGLRKDDEVAVYFPSMCRTFHLKFRTEREVKGVRALNFRSMQESYDTNRWENTGFRYANHEGVNYYPDWPDCANASKPVAVVDCNLLDCSLGDNMCNKKCCNGSYWRSRYLLPPGMYPVPCNPASPTPPLFQLILSPPHFAFSPEEVLRSVDGMHGPDVEIDVPISVDYEPNSGTLLRLNVSVQLSVPIFRFRDNSSIVAAHLPNKILPLMHVHSTTVLKDFVYDRMRISFTIIPLVLLYAKLGCTILSVLAVALTAVQLARHFC